MSEPTSRRVQSDDDRDYLVQKRPTWDDDKNPQWVIDRATFRSHAEAVYYRDQEIEDGYARPERIRIVSAPRQVWTVEPNVTAPARGQS